MKELPIEGRQSQIQGASPVTGFSQAVEPLVQHHRSMAKFGMQFAQNAANERATLEGIQSAQEGTGKNLFPAITEADKHFHEAYKNEELQIKSADANSFLQNITLQAFKDPNPSLKTLEAFENGSQQALEGFAKDVSPENRTKFLRSLQAAYEANKLQLIEKIHKSDLKYMDSQSNKAFDENIKNMQNYRMLNNEDAANDAYQQALEIINQREINGQDLPDVAEKKREALKEVNEIARYQRKTQAALQSGNYDEYISELRKNPPKNLDPITHDAIIKSSMHYANQYNAALEGQRNLEYLNYQKSREEGNLTASMMAEAEEKIGSEKFARLQLQMAKDNADQNNLNVLTSKMVPNFSNVDKMSQYTDKEVNSVYERQVALAEQSMGVEPGDLPLSQQAMIAQEIKAPVSSLADKIDSRLLAGDAQSAAEAAQIVSTLNKNNPIALSGLLKESKALALSIDDAIKNGMDPQIAVELKRQRILGVDEKVIEEREKKYNELTKGPRAGRLNFQDSNKAISYVADSLGFSKGKIPVGLATEFLNMQKDLYVVYGDFNEATKATKEVFDRTYGETNINGKDEVMFAPIEKFLPYGTNAKQFVKNQFISEFKDIEAASKQMFEKGGSPYHYELTDEKSDRVKIKQVFRNGEVKEGYLIINADRKTTIPEDGTMPSYWLGIDINGVKTGIIDPRNQSSVRIKPDVDKYVRQTQEKIQQEEEKALESGRKEIEKRKEVDKALMTIIKAEGLEG